MWFDTIEQATMNRRVMSAVAIAAVLMTAARPSHAQQTDAAAAQQGDLLDRAVAVWANVKTARATFEQTITIALTGREMTTGGEYQQERPGKLAVTFSHPAEDRIVADGKFVWLYLPSSAPDQVIKTAQGTSGSGTVDLTAQFLTNPRGRYEVTSVGTNIVSGRPTHGYTLLPKTDRSAPFKQASVWIDDADATIRQFEVTENSGLLRKVRLITFRTNVPVDEKAFTFTVPNGVRVVTQ
jgi:outer membrane lipoprotein carrier protein